MQEQDVALLINPVGSCNLLAVYHSAMTQVIYNIQFVSQNYFLQ